MNKQELIERIEELKYEVNNLRGEAFGIADEMNTNTEELTKIYDVLITADESIDTAFDELEEALDRAQKLDEYGYTTTYAHMAKHIRNKILCNSIAANDESITNTQVHSKDYEPTETDEVFQWYLTDCDDDDVQWLTENFSQVHFYYSEMLNLWVLAVYHFGTSWDYVMIETKLEYCEREEGQE